MNTTTPNPPWSTERIAVSLIYSLTAAVGIGLYVIFLRIADRAGFVRSFAALIKQLAVADIGMLLLNPLVYAPMTLTGRDLFGYWGSIALASLDGLWWFSLEFTSLLIALNRFGALVMPQLGRWAFEQHLHLTMSTAWIVGVFFTISPSAVGCHKIYLKDSYGITYLCGNLAENATAMAKARDFIMGLNGFWVWSVVILIVALYVCIFLFLQYQKRNSSITFTDNEARKRHKQEISCLIQGFIIGITLAAVLCAFWGIFALKWENHFVGVFIISAVTFNSSVNPLVYFLFNRKVRQQALLVWCGVEPSDVTPADRRKQSQAATNETRAKTRSAAAVDLEIKQAANGQVNSKIVVAGENLDKEASGAPMSLD